MATLQKVGVHEEEGCLSTEGEVALGHQVPQPAVSQAEGAKSATLAGQHKVKQTKALGLTTAL